LPELASIVDLLAQVEAKGHEVWTAGPQSESAILELEKALGVNLPPSYRAFLRRFGSMAIYDSTVSGILQGRPLETRTGWLYGDTMQLRRKKSSLSNLLVIQPDDEGPYCLDTQRPSPDGELPVVCYELGSEHASTIATNFDDWMRRFFLHWVNVEA
jgi:hypothetical protein